MNKIGSFLRKKTPGLYRFLVSILNSIKKIREPYYIYITDSLGGSFKTYLKDNDEAQLVSMLTSETDDESIATVNVIIERLKHYPDESNKSRIDKHAPIVGGLLPVEQERIGKLIKEKMSQLHKHTRFPLKHMEDSVFYFYHGLSLLPDSVKDYVKNEHFVDIGAFIGDSIVALNDFGYSKIFSIEMSKKSIAILKDNMEVCGIPKEKFEVINVGIAGQNNLEDIKLFDTGSSGLSIKRMRGKYDEITVKLRSFDHVVDKFKIQPKFIKVDIEGYGLEFIKGAKESIKKYRPIISLAIYHNPREFFEAKPMLEGLLSDYTFMIRKLEHGVKKNLCHSEVILLAFPNESILD